VADGVIRCVAYVAGGCHLWILGILFEFRFGCDLAKSDPGGTFDKVCRELPCMADGVGDGAHSLGK
jgi:hypothetical protein